MLMQIVMRVIMMQVAMFDVWIDTHGCVLAGIAMFSPLTVHRCDVAEMIGLRIDGILQAIDRSSIIIGRNDALT